MTPVETTKPFKVQYQNCGDAYYLQDHRVRMPDGRIYAIAGLGDHTDDYLDGPEKLLRRLFDEVERVWDMHDSDLPGDADVQFVTLGTFLKDLLFRYKRENISMSAISGYRLHFYLGDEMIHEVAGLTVDHLLAYALKLERETK